MKKILTTILMFLGLLTLGVTIGANAATNKEVTYTIASTSSVTCDDSALLWNASYSQTYSTKGQITSGNSMTFSLTGLESNVSIVKVVMSMHTNSSKGAGTVEVKIGETVVSNKDYDKPKGTNWVDYEVENTNSATGDLNVKIECTTNSLYCQTFKVIYKLTDDTTPSYNTIFNLNYDGAADNETISTDEGAEVEFISNPIREGYIFVGWYDAAEGGTQITSLVSSAENNDKVLYAHWEVDPYSYATIVPTHFTTAGYADNNHSHVLTNNGKNEFSFTSNQIMRSSELIQFQKNAGYLYNNTNVKGCIASIEIEIIEGELTVYTSDSVITDPTGLTGTVLSSTNSIYKVPEGTQHTYFYLEVGTTAGKASAIKIQYLYDEAFSKYSVGFNAGKGVFKADKGTTLQEVEGTSISGTLPTADDLEMTAYKYTTLTGWSDGKTTYEPGAAFTVSSLTVFNAVYAVPDKITVAQAKEIAGLAGTTKTDYKFICEGIVSSIEKTTDTQIQFTLKDLVSEDTIIVYNAKLGSQIYVGDHVAVTGNLINYNETTLEFVADSSYVVTDNSIISSFVNTTTQKSLKAQYDSNFAPVDVDLRFGAKISLDAYHEDAVYGVMAIDAASCAGFVSGATEYATADEFLAANAGVKKMECPNRAVLADGCQFAWVITDMEGHYKNYFTAVIYMEYNGVLYLGVSTVASVASTATDYLNSEDPAVQATLTEDVKKVLQNIIDHE